MASALRATTSARPTAINIIWAIPKAEAPEPILAALPHVRCIAQGRMTVAVATRDGAGLVVRLDSRSPGGLSGATQQRHTVSPMTTSAATTTMSAGLAGTVEVPVQRSDTLSVYYLPASVRSSCAFRYSNIRMFYFCSCSRRFSRTWRGAESRPMVRQRITGNLGATRTFLL